MNKQKLLYVYPPDIQKSQKHRMAKRIFKGIQHNPSCPECQCCDRKIGIKDVDLSCCYNIHELAFLGPGIPLFFCYLKNSIILLLVLIIIFVGFCIYSNISSNYCSYSSSKCDYNIFNTLSILNKINKSDYLSIQNYILVGFTIICSFLFQWFRYNFRKVQQQCDDIIDSPSDYAIILRRLPPNVVEKDIQDMISQRRNFLTNQERQLTENLKIDHIVLSFSLSEYTRINSQNLQQFKQKIEQQKINQFNPTPLPTFKQTASIAIVIFAKQQSKQLFLYKPSFFQKFLQCLCTPCTPLSDFKVKQQPISVQRAPEPDDIVWQNTKISIGGAICRKTIYNIFSILILLIGGGAQYGLALLQNQITNPSGKTLMSIALSLLITVFNFVILQFLIYTSQKQRNQTLTEYNTVLTVKISFFQFLNTGIFVILGNFLADVNNFTLEDGMPFQIYLVMVVNAISPNLSLWILNYFQISGKIFRWMIRTNKLIATQSQANTCWQTPNPQIPYKYSYVLKTIWLTAFYTPFAPIVVIISTVGLAFNYLIQKYLYGFVYSMPNMLSSMVNDSAIQLMEYFPLILSLGQFIIYLYFMSYNISLIPLNWQIPIYASIAISLLNLLLPMDQLNKYILKLPIDSMTFPSYQKVQHKFQVTYQMTNPAYVCKRKRRRDVFLINHIFGGQGKNVALEMTQLFGLNSDDGNEGNAIKSPLLKEKQAYSNINQNIDDSNPFLNLFAPTTFNQQQIVNENALKQQNHSSIKSKKKKNQLPNFGNIGISMINNNQNINKNDQNIDYVVQNSVKKQDIKLNLNQLQSYRQLSKMKEVQNNSKVQKQSKTKQLNKAKGNSNFKKDNKNIVDSPKRQNVPNIFELPYQQKINNTVGKRKDFQRSSSNKEEINYSKTIKQMTDPQFRQSQIYSPKGRFTAQKSVNPFQERYFKGSYQIQNTKKNPFSSFFK